MARYNYLAEVKKVARTIAKNDTLIIQRDGDNVYICNSYYIVKVPAALYEEAFRTVSPRFIELATDKVVRANNKNELPTVAVGLDVNNLLPRLYDFEPAEMTPFAMDNSDGKKLRVFFSGENQIFVNDDFVQTLKVFASGQVYGKTCKTPIFTDFANDTAIMICPVNVQNYGKFQLVNTDNTGKKVNAA